MKNFDVLAWLHSLSGRQYVNATLRGLKTPVERPAHIDKFATKGYNKARECARRCRQIERGILKVG